METASLVQLARSMPRARFAASFRNHFLLFEGRTRSDDFDFDTAVVDTPAESEGGGDVEAVELVKAKGNPYPDRISIGRARNCDVVLRDPSVSKLHAHIREAQGQLHVVDLGSHNGTKLNGKALVAHQPSRAAVGDRLEFGSVHARLYDAAALYDRLRNGG
jgi:hypothetical protein